VKKEGGGGKKGGGEGGEKKKGGGRDSIQCFFFNPTLCSISGINIWNEREGRGKKKKEKEKGGRKVSHLTLLSINFSSIALQ